MSISKFSVYNTQLSAQCSWLQRALFDYMEILFKILKYHTLFLKFETGFKVLKKEKETSFFYLGLKKKKQKSWFVPFCTELAFSNTSRKQQKN